eukprot:CAMPEP_0172422696 /NCGR_PEP_ID=MMETSP1064-20121228/8835_1 /TAXON_ID=202472 /ORGANISM="Aulacoseira subarctica , Strain CCAP 1002/5" /LENGTH=369 /DNA_ID=CAMNT_0013163687 /DNA_START=108 /DNA_END=1217 /DNA_ORIENTATION=+
MTFFFSSLSMAVPVCNRDTTKWQWFFVLSIISNGCSIWYLRHIRVMYAQGLVGGASSPDEIPKIVNDYHQCLQNKVVLITGANSGIGKETAQQLLQYGASTVILACRNKQRAEEAMQDIIRRQKSEDKEDYKERLRFLPLDLSDLQSVRAAAKIFLEWNLPLDILINNAGIMMGSFHLTKEGNEFTMTSNHLGHFLLTLLLMPALTASSTTPARIINVTSSTYTLAPYMDMDDLFCTKGLRQYTLFGQYAQSKLANILFTLELAKRYPDIIRSYAVHPGLVRTNVVQNLPWYLYYPNQIFGFLLQTLQKTAPAGAYTSVHCAASTALGEERGLYYSNCKVCDTTKAAKDSDAAKKLWELSETLVNITKQ